VPQFWIRDGEDERSTARSGSSSFDVLRMWLVDDYLDRTTGVGATVYGNVDSGFLVRFQLEDF
jgi:hypothetical protein